MQGKYVNRLRITSILLALLFFLLMSTSITHAETYSLVKEWGSRGIGDGQFSFGPHGIAVDSSGNVYVGEVGGGYNATNDHIQKFDSNGNFIAKFGYDGTGDGQLLNPQYVAVDSYNNVYIVSINQNNSNIVQKFTSNGGFITKWGSIGTGDGQFHQPMGIAIDSVGNVYITDSYNERVQKFTSNGEFITKWGSFGTGDGQFNFPTSVAVDSVGNVYVIDSRNSRVQKFTSNGEFITKWGSFGTGDGQFKQYALGIAVDSSDNVYVVDTYNKRIQKFDSSGNFITKWYGTGDRQLNCPIGADIDSSGNVYVTDYYVGYVYKYAPNLPIADFISNVTQGTVPFSVKFKDKSKNATGWMWDFGDGITSTEQNPIHTFSVAKTHTVTLTASNAVGTDSKSIIISAQLLEANFTSNVNKSFIHLPVKFTDTSTGSPTSWLWDFGDGNTSTEQNPTYTYYKAGNYTVTLTASNSEGTDSASQTVSVNDLAFKVNPQKIRISDKVEFNASQYISSTGRSITWDFGDGKTDLSNSPIVYHNYSEPGSYTAKITITDSKGNVATKSQFVNVTIPVVLVHGFMSSSETWVDMSSALQKNGFEVWNFDYGTYSTQNPQDTVPKLSDFIDGKRNDLSYNGQKYNGKIDIVCHSMGSIVSRLYMEHYQGGIHGKDVRQWIGIAPAHGGSAGADLHLSAEPNPLEHPFIWITFKSLTTLLEPEAIDELTTTSDSVKTLSTGSLSSNTKYRVIAGWNPTHSTNFGWGVLSVTRAKNASRPGSPYYWTYSGDMIIATAQSYDERIKDFEAFPIDGDLGGSPAYEFDHVHITKSPKVINYVTECLKDIDKISSNKLPSDDEVSFFTPLKKVIKGILSTKEQQVNLPVPELIPIGSNAGSNLNVVSNSLTNAQDTSSSQENVVLDVILEWDDGDVSVNLISPSGTEYSADSHASNVGYFKDENSLNYIIPDPESGNWTAELIPEEYPGHDIHYNLTYSLECIGSDGSNYYPVANFTSNLTTGYAPLTVQFTDLSNNAISWKWDFGDGTSSTEQDPVHIYTKEGDYTVSLNSSNSIGYSTKQTTIAVKSNSASTTTASYTPTSDNRLRSGSPTSVLSTTTYLDIGRSSATVRDLLLFDLSSYKTTDTISKATLSLYWYYPAGATRTSDTVVEVYRPVEWDPKYVTWNSRVSGTLWKTAGGSWYDKNGLAQGTTPYASITFPASTVPDNKYYDFDVTQLVQEYVSGKYANTGFFLKAKTESGNYIAFYSADASNTAVRPKLTVTSASGASAVDNQPVANAGADKTAMAGSTVIFNASASTDDKGIASYSWDFDLSNGITTEATTMTASHIFTVAGTYTATLTVTDTAGQVATDTVQVVISSTASTSTASYAPTYDNRLRSASPTSILSTTTYLDIGRSSATIRDVILFDLSSYKTTDTISKATLSLYWYYPAGTTRTSDTVVEVYRPVEWDPKYVTWNSRASGTLWTTAGGNWYDKNAVSQGTTPYASTTFTASTVPDNKYYEFDVTQLVQEYVSGKYANTGFFLKAKTESGNYIAFYSSEASNTAVRPKLTITSVSGSTSVDNPPVANAGADKTVIVGTSVTFDGSASTDDKGIASYSWDFDLSNGITAEAATMIASKTYTTTGTYTATLTVTDTAGQKSTDTVQVVVSSASSPVSTVSYTPTYDNRLRSASPTSVLSTTTYLDIGRSSATIRDLLLFDLSSYKTTDTISKATLSLYWYYPAGTTRTSDTVVEVYRPVEWDPKYVTWNSRVSGTLWTTAGGNWYDKNSIAQGTTPYASVTFAGTKLPDNKYYEFDVTQLVQEYVSGKYKNTGFFLKAKTESGNYIAFYSADASNTAVRPKLTITS